jgi:hypothetical protein
MAKKYVRFQVIGDNSDPIGLEDYQDALKEYGHAEAPKTLYGINEMNEFSIIFSKL